MPHGERVMSKTDLIFSLLRQRNLQLSQIEKFLLEIKLLTLIHRELSEFFKSQYCEYIQLIKSDQEPENMCNIKFMQETIKDILSTNEYSFPGIAAYTRIPEDVLYDVAAGINTNPTFEVSRRIFELHIEVRRDLYDGILRKIASEFFATIGQEIIQNPCVIVPRKVGKNMVFSRYHRLRTS